MARIKTCEATDVALDWLVAKCSGDSVRYSKPHEQLLVEGYPYMVWQPHKNWAQGGPIIEREELSISCEPDGKWHSESPSGWQYGPTPLIAAMRCYVASKLGDEVEVPDEIV